MKVDLIKLQEEIDGDWVNAQVHPVLPLRILKYSKSAVYTARWNEITLRARGVVIDEAGNIVINGFEKFFNNNQAEGVADYERSKHLPYVVSVKEDGSLIQVANWNGNRVVSSSGSFTSTQAIKAAQVLDSHYPHCKIENGKTYLFEYIAPDNRIVLNYGDLVALTLLAIKDTETGEELPLDKNFKCVESVGLTIEEILAELPRVDFINKEGYVIRFSNGVRVKYKYDKYCLLHKTISGISEKWVWECMKDGVDTNATLVDVPDELYDFIDSTKAFLTESFNKILNEAKAVYDEVKLQPTRKEQAALLLSKYKSNAKLVFSLLDGRDVSEMIWKMIEPDGATQRKFGMGELTVGESDE